MFMDVREGASGASTDAPGRRSGSAVSLIFVWQMTRNSDIDERKRERGKKITGRDREKCCISPEYILFFVKSWIFCFVGIFMISFKIVFRVYLCRS